MTHQGEADPRPYAPDLERPTTGDGDVNLILTDFARAVRPHEGVDPDAAREELTRHVEAATRAHKRLQDRLSAPRG